MFFNQLELVMCMGNFVMFFRICDVYGEFCDVL